MDGKLFAMKYTNIKDHVYNLELCKDILKSQDDEFLTQEALKALDKRQNKLRQILNRLGNMKAK